MLQAASWWVCVMTVRAERFHSTPLQWPPPWDELDLGIVEVVRVLVDAGYETLASCEGHDGGVPQVSIRVIRPSADWEQAKLIGWLRDNGLQGCFVHCSYGVNKSYVDGPFLTIEWWSKQVIEDWLADKRKDTAHGG